MELIAYSCISSGGKRALKAKEFRIEEYNADKLNEELASGFIVTTCQLLIPRSSDIYSDNMRNLLAYESGEPIGYTVVCGSTAEFYIRPLLRCIDDIDRLVGHIDELVFSGEFPVLPSDLSCLADRVTCFKIEPYDRYPGFVRLKLWGEMSYNWKYSKYEFHLTSRASGYAVGDLDILADWYSPLTLKKMAMKRTVSGPAVNQQSVEHPRSFVGSDIVRCMWCPQWPKEAQSWLNRPRLNGWPTNNTISEVVQNGCHVVYVKHRSCRNDELQWRFSFSLAEVILLQSWTQTQQIVYHLLRYFGKRELMRKNCAKEDEVLCTYHLKTLMLWTCEDMPSEWWNLSSVISVCWELLNKLSEWLKRKFFPNYFISEANLFKDHANPNILEKTVTQLNKFLSYGILCRWFVENYILFFIRKHFKPREKMSHFVDYMLPLLEFWKANQLRSLELYSFKSIAFSHRSCRYILKRGLKSGLRQSLMMQDKCSRPVSVEQKTMNNPDLKTNSGIRDLPVIESVLYFTHHDNLLYMLHAAYGVECGDISWDSNLCVEAVNAISLQPKITRSACHNFPRTCTSQRSRSQFLCFQNFMENLTGSNSHSEYQLLSLMTKELFRKLLKYDDTMSDGISHAALAYLAAIHFATSEYQDARRLCSAVLMTSEEDMETLNAGCLLFIDDIASIVGLCVLQKAIVDDCHCIGRRFFLDLRLSPEVFARYLSVLSAERMSKQPDLYHDLLDSSFPMDVNLKALIKPKFVFSTISKAARQVVYRRPDSLTESEASSANPSIVKERVLHALMEYAVEKMTLFYNGIRKDLGVNCNISDAYVALYLYKCRHYDDVLHLCEQILKASEPQSDLKEFSFASVLLLPPFDSFFDIEMQSLLGFHTLFYYLSPLNDEVEKVKLTAESTFAQWFARDVYACKHDIVRSLKYHYSIKCHYFLGRHFVAKYLKVRCCIGCSLPYSKAWDEIACHKTNLPFERIICEFLLRKLRI